MCARELRIENWNHEADFYFEPERSDALLQIEISGNFKTSSVCNYEGPCCQEMKFFGNIICSILQTFKGLPEKVFCSKANTAAVSLFVPENVTLLLQRMIQQTDEWLSKKLLTCRGLIACKRFQYFCEISPLNEGRQTWKKTCVKQRQKQTTQNEIRMGDARKKRFCFQDWGSILKTYSKVGINTHMWGSDRHHSIW